MSESTVIVTGLCKACRGRFALTKKSKVRNHYLKKSTLPCWGSQKIPNKVFISVEDREVEATIKDPKLRPVVLSSKFMLWASIKGINYEDAVVLRDGYNLAKENGIRDVTYGQMLVENALTLATKGAWNRTANG